MTLVHPADCCRVGSKDYLICNPWAGESRTRQSLIVVLGLTRTLAVLGALPRALYGQLLDATGRLWVLNTCLNIQGLLGNGVLR